MATITKKRLALQGEDAYFQKFIFKNGQEYGLRFATPKDAATISSLFKETYNYEYPYPYVYDTNLLKNDISKPNKFWVLSDLLENNMTVGCALVDKERYIAHAGCLIVKKDFQRQGITTNLAAAGLITVTKMPQFKDILRLNTEVRAPLTQVQTSAQNAGAIPYGIIPSHINLADNRYFDFDDNNPCSAQNEEFSTVLYSIIFRSLWKKRDKNVFLLDNEDFIFLYEYIRNQVKKMKDDALILEKEKNNQGYELYGVSKDYYLSHVKLFGYIKKKSISNLLRTYKNWRIIFWKVPATKNGISSMSLALKKGFKIVGYDIGFNNINGT
ncbi:MAG: GNAT family N-acetyltransferase, partial [Promethearchaeota archaeon]